MEEHHNQNETHTSSAVSRVLLSKVLSHKLFSEKVLYWLLIAISFLLPLFFIPGQFMAPEFGKMLLLEVATFIGILLWAIARFRDREIQIPKSWLLLVSVLLIIQFVVSAIVSPTPALSFVGSGYDVGTVNTFVVLFLLMFLGSIVFTNKDRILTLYASVVFSGLIATLYHAARYFLGADFLSFGFFTSDVSSIVGKWNDFAAIVGAIMMLVLVTMYFFSQNKALRIPAYIIFFVCLFFLIIIDFTVLWRTLFALTALFVGYAIYEGEKEHKRLANEAAQTGAVHHHKPAHKRVVKHLPGFAVVLLLVAFIYGSGLSNVTWGKDNVSISTFIGKTLHAPQYSEVVLTSKFTTEIITNTFKESPLFGTGPNRFSAEFLKVKSSDMNKTPFWDAVFDFGLGRIPTYFSTTGIIGTVLWIIFILILFLKGKKLFSLLTKDRVTGYLGFSLYILVLYFWSIAFFYLPSIAVYSLAFLLTGALIAFLSSEGIVGTLKFDFATKGRSSFIVTPVVVIVLIGVISSNVLLYRQISSLVAYRDAQLALGANDFDKAQAALLKANNLSERDIYNRILSNLALLKLQQLSRNTDLSKEEIQTRANQFISDARTYAERAVKLDPTNFENYLQLGGVYDSLGLLGIQNTVQPAQDNYEQALRLNPKSPRVMFILARLEYVSGDRTKTKEYLYKALNERPNFLEAASLLVQLEMQDKNPEAAEKILLAGVNNDPTNFLLRFALGYYYYGLAKYPQAIEQLEPAVFLNPVYADAMYFLSLSYAHVGRTDDALKVMTRVQELNPGNKDVTNALKKINEGELVSSDKYIPSIPPANNNLEQIKTNSSSANE